jgi:hypothetical protein
VNDQEARYLGDELRLMIEGNYQATVDMGPRLALPDTSLGMMASSATLDTAH